MDELKPNIPNNQNVDLASLTKHERKLLKQKLKTEKRVQQSQEQRSINKKKTLKRFSVVLLVLLIFGGGVTGFVIYNNNKAGPYDDFAKCLTQKGAVMYGGINWCSFTKEQANMFGSSFKYINYKDFSELKDIKYTPTWVIDGKWYERVQSFQRLSEITGCQYSGAS